MNRSPEHHYSPQLYSIRWYKFCIFFFAGRTRKHLDVLIIFWRKLPSAPSFYPCWPSLCSCWMSYASRNEDHLSKSCPEQNSLPSKLWCCEPMGAVNLISNTLDIFFELIIVWLSQSDTQSWIQLKFCQRNLNKILRWETPFFFFSFFFFSFFLSFSKAAAYQELPRDQCLHCLHFQKYSSSGYVILTTSFHTEQPQFSLFGIICYILLFLYWPVKHIQD